MGTRKKDSPWWNLSDPDWEGCARFAEALVEDLKRPERVATVAHTVNDIDKDPIKQRNCRLGEVGMCRIMGWSVGQLNWKIGTGDKGWDVEIDRDKIDAKTSWSPSSRFLIHTVKDAHDLPRLIRADKLVLVQLDVENRRVRLRGYLTKARFLEIHKIASEFYPRKDNAPMLIPDTPFVEVDQLDDIQELIDAHKVKHFEETR